MSSIYRVIRIIKVLIVNNMYNIIKMGSYISITKNSTNSINKAENAIKARFNLKKI